MSIRITKSDTTSWAHASTELDPLVTDRKIGRKSSEKNVVEAAVTPSLRSDAIDTALLSVPLFISMLSWVGMTTIDTSLLGHVGPDALAALALSDLWTMCTGVFVKGRVLGIIAGQAMGAKNPKLAAIYLQVSIFLLFSIAIFILVAWNSTEIVWLAFGENEELASKAGYFASVTSISIPAQIVFSETSSFLLAQRITQPQVLSSICALVFNLIFGLIFVLGIPIPDFFGFGFNACPVVTTFVEYVNVAVMLYLYISRHKDSWYGWQWVEITRERVILYAKLYIPAALGIASDFWRMAFIGVMAARIGVVEVSVFNTSYRIMWITLTATGAIAGASGIKMGLRLGSGNHIGAKQAGDLCIGICLGLLLVISALLLIDIKLFGRIFSSDDDFLNTLDECKYPFVATLFLMNLACAIEKIPISMGRTADVFWMGFFGSWFGQVPGVLLLTTYWRNDLFGVYSGMAIGYLLLVILYAVMAFTSDWKKYSDVARKRAEISDDNNTPDHVIA